MPDTEPLECIEDPADCWGPVAYRMALSPSGESFPRCEHHWEARLDDEAMMIPDSDVPPAWFDPELIGERWDSDY